MEFAGRQKGRFIPEFWVRTMCSGPGVVPVQRGMEFHPFSIPAPGLSTLGQNAGKPCFIGHGKSFVEQAVEQVL
jgi:hypothetical protein